jgi:hypothetical protein
MQHTALTAAVAMLACGNMAAAQQVSDAYSTMSPEGLRTGVIVREADCARDPIAVWVTAPHADGTVEGACIRYYAAGLAASNPVAIVFLHGNRLDRSFDKEGRLIRVDASATAYGKPSAAGLAASAAQQAKALGHPFIILARPGYYGSSGIANEQYRRREVLLVNAALDATRDTPAMPPTPAMFSSRTGWPRAAPSPGARRRATRSVEPPGA